MPAGDDFRSFPVTQWSLVSQIMVVAPGRVVSGQEGRDIRRPLGRNGRLPPKVQPSLTQVIVARADLRGITA